MLTTTPGQVAITSSGEEKEMTSREALAVIDSLPEDQHLVVDFDWTFFLSNSSTEFIRMARPYCLSAILMKVLEILKPWVLISGKKKSGFTRDWFRIWAVLIFFPWTWLLWRKQAKKMARVWTNQELADRLRKRDPRYTVLSSLGFEPIVRPLLKHMGVEFGAVDTCRLVAGLKDRVVSKIDRLKKVIGEQNLRRAAVVTDSEDDRDLLDYVKTPILLRWPNPPVKAVSSHYAPFLYMYKVKHQGFAAILRDILMVDLILLWMAYSWISPFPVIHGIGISFFFLSFLLIYEIGYMENDEVGHALEADPELADNFEEKRDYICYVEPWFWALGFAFAGAIVFTMIDLWSASGSAVLPWLDLPLWSESVSAVLRDKSLYGLTLIWVAVLVSQRIVYRVYNYTDKMTRTWIYPLLQSYKSVVFMLISSINLIGAVGLLSQLASRSFGYFIYRWGRVSWPGNEVYLARILIFIAGLVVITGATHAMYVHLLTWQTFVISLWMVSRAIKPAIFVWGDVKHVAKDPWKKTGK